MKTKLMAASTMAAMTAMTSTAFAQTNVSIYGVADVAFVAESGGAAGSVKKLTSGVGSGSRLGFKGSEDLGGGLSALFALENGFNLDTGTLGQGGLLFGRQAYVGLSGGFGTATFGRQYTPQFLTVLTADPFGTGSAGNAPNILPLTGSGSRMDNAFKYVTPNFSGMTGEFAYGFGEVAGDTSAARQLGVAVNYTGGPLTVRLGHHNRNNDTATVKNTESGKNTLLAATYDFGVAKAYFAYGVNKGPNSGTLRNATNPYRSAVAPTPSTDSRDALLGVLVPFGTNRVMASYIRKDDKTAFNQDANQLAVGYFYGLSKRTDLYAVYARIDNKNGAGYTVGGAIEPGSGDKALNLGIRHTF